MHSIQRPALPRPDETPTDRFTAIPRALTDRQAELRLTPRQVQLAVHLLSFKWFEDSPICPSVPTLARAMACSVRTVQRAIDGLVGHGLLTVEAQKRADGGRSSNEYHLAPWLLTAVTPRRDHGGTSESPGRHRPGDNRGSRTTRTRNYQPRTTQPNGRHTPPSSAAELLQTREGALRRR